MLKLKGITKEYDAGGDSRVEALKGISIEFRRHEFVSVLGPSGCGKTTLLNIIGGLDRYTHGDLEIEGISTREYTDRDWDAYRNHSVGFIFQSYNLIPHQSILANVELALTISGVGKRERRARAKAALESVGLGDKLRKRPNQLSGGQMQRVAIARALVNNPEILLADEPTGALDSATSIQIMELLRSIAKDRLIIMVTHNPELAAKYSGRIVRLLDGRVVSDSNPYYEAEFKAPGSEVKKLKRKKLPSMSGSAAFGLSLNNLLTKKGRTFLTAFAGSIGIIGIALILSISNGIQNYINRVQEDTLSSYPITLEEESMDLTSLMETFTGKASGNTEHTLDKIYSTTIMADLMNSLMEETQSNNLEAFKDYIESGESDFNDYVSSVSYSYGVDPEVYYENSDGELLQVNPSNLFAELYGDSVSGMMTSNSTMMSRFNVWEEMLDDDELLQTQYDVIAGRWPEAANEIVLMVSENNEVSDMVLYSLGLKDSSEVKDIMAAAANGETLETEVLELSYDEVLALRYSLVLPSEYYVKNEDGTYSDSREDEEALAEVVANGMELRVVGILRPSEAAVTTAMSGAIGYLPSLTEYIINANNDTEIVKAQLADPETDVFTGIAFESNEDEVPEVTMDVINAYVATLSEEEQAEMKAYMSMMSEEQLIALFTEKMTPPTTDATYDGNIDLLGVKSLDAPSTIEIYANTFDDKDRITEIIDDYNEQMEAAGKEERIISYTDYVGILMSSVSTIINVISYVLIAFVSISLVVSSIMIGIITYISVLERTKEIGVLRSIGASKHDVSRLFNAETIMIGLTSGIAGIGITLLLDIPIDMIINHLAGIEHITNLPWAASLILIGISVLLTLIAGLVPAGLAAKKDPVVALRSGD